MRARKSVGIGLLLVASLFLMWGTTIAQDEPVVGPKVGNLAPDFTLPDVNIEAVNEVANAEVEEPLVVYSEDGEFTLSDHRGRVVVMTFWGWSCVSCKEEEMPALQHEVWDIYPRDQVLVVSINIDPTPNMDDITGYIGEKEITYPMLAKAASGPNDPSGLKTAADYQIFATPILLILDHEGVIRFKEGNRLFDEGVKEFIDGLVAELPEPEEGS